MPDRQSLLMRTNHLLLLIFVVVALVLALYGTMTGDAFYLRLGTEALIFAGLALSGRPTYRSSRPEGASSG